jgi:uncharacterized protein YecT (DUF1311 family)/tRNA A-37 threonylcarbamoyl transferase component Bud32
MATDADFPSDLRALEREYELIRELGQGGMAAVYLARRRLSGRLVAIKAIRGRYVDDPDAIQRFAREARTVAGLDHPNIVRTEAIEQIDDRAVAIIMEHVPGGTVRDWLREHGSLGAEQAEGILRDVANALGYAHRRGLVHRDVKPENVFLDELRGRALLSDFGIARKIDGDGSITLLGAALGTPQYMSPEQIDGEMVDGRSDIYSLGVLGWELLTGRRPWAGESLYGVIYKQKHEQLPRITSLRPRVPANLLFAIEGALVKGKNERWQTIDEFLTQLTYNPPPVLSQTYPPGATPVDNEPTVRFRSSTVEADEPAVVEPMDEPAAELELVANVDDVDDVSMDVVPSREPVPVVTTELSAADATASLADSPLSETDYPVLMPEPNDEPAFEFTPRRTRVVQALALVIPLAIAATTMFVVLSGSAPDTARPSGRTSGVTSSAGSVVADSVPAASPTASRGDLLAAPGGSSPADGPVALVAGSSVSSPPSSSATVANSHIQRTRTGGSTTTKASPPSSRRSRVGTSRSVVAVLPPGPAIDSGPAAVVAKVDPSGGSRVTSEPPAEDPFKIPEPATKSAPTKSSASGAASAAPIARCRFGTTADQRACLGAYVEAGDATLNRTFDSLVSELRRVAGTPAGAPDPLTVQRIRVEQRTWLNVREAECPRQPAADAGEFWAQAQSQCFAEMADSRTKDLRDAVRRLSRK